MNVQLDFEAHQGCDRRLESSSAWRSMPRSTRRRSCVSGAATAFGGSRIRIRTSRSSTPQCPHAAGDQRGMHCPGGATGLGLNAKINLRPLFDRKNILSDLRRATRSVSTKFAGGGGGRSLR